MVKDLEEDIKAAIEADTPQWRAGE